MKKLQCAGPWITLFNSHSSLGNHRYHCFPILCEEHEACSHSAISLRWCKLYTAWCWPLSWLLFFRTFNCWTRQFRGYSWSFFPVFVFLRQGLVVLSKLPLGSWFSSLGLPSSWDCRPTNRPSSFLIFVQCVTWSWNLGSTISHQLVAKKAGDQRQFGTRKGHSLLLLT